MIAIYLFVGMLAGLMSGLFGLGGGVIVVPALSYVFLNLVQGIPNPLTMHMAIGTSLAIMVVTASAAAYSHHRAAHVQWAICRRWMLGLVIGALLGSVLADVLPSHVLRLVFGLFLLFTSIKMLFNIKVWIPRSRRGMTVQSSSETVIPSLPVMLSVGAVFGVICGLLGVGGGAFMVPFLVSCHYEMKYASGTSVASSLPVALVGSLAYIVLGWHQTVDIPWSFGYVYLPALLGVMITSMLFAPLGMKLTKILPSVLLKRLFSIVLFIIALDMMMPGG